MSITKIRIIKTHFLFDHNCKIQNKFVFKIGYRIETQIHITLSKFGNQIHPKYIEKKLKV